MNARDAIAGVGEIVIETGSATMDAAYCDLHAEAMPGAYVCLSVSDDGRGTTFKIYLPEVGAETVKTTTTAKTESPSGRGDMKGAKDGAVGLHPIAIRLRVT